MSLAHRLYTGDASVEFIARRKIWYAFSALLITVGVIAMIFRGFNFGIDFRGGDAFQFKAGTHSVADAKRVLAEQGVQDPVVTKIGQDQIKVTTKPLETSSDPAKDKVTQVSNALAKEFGLSPDELNPETVGASWGSSITTKAVQGLIIFLIIVSIFISIFFEGKMALAAMIALVHDLVITAGIYALVGFEVTPNTVIALLTILGFSLYDTVVVFDTVRETTAKIGPRSTETYSMAANRAINQTLMRSINTSIIALLPVAALLFVGAGLLGAGTLKELALAQLVGLAAGTYSSIFIATPLLAQFREREPDMIDLRKRVAFLAQHKPKATAAAGGAAGAPGRQGVAVLERTAEDVPAEEPTPAQATPPRVPGAPMVRSDARNRGRSGGSRRTKRRR
jgi:preprotein translocase subunit SecF